jgi:hypothetical protein
VHTIWCKQNPTGIDPGISLCLNFDINKFYFTLKDGSLSLGLGVGNDLCSKLFDFPDCKDDVPITGMVP